MESNHKVKYDRTLRIEFDTCLIMVTLTLYLCNICYATCIMSHDNDVVTRFCKEFMKKRHLGFIKLKRK